MYADTDRSWVFTEDIGNLEGAKLAPIMPKVIIEPVNENAIVPKYAHDGDSGMDVYATEDVIIKPGETVQIGLGFKLGIPKHPLHAFGYRWECQVRPRSGTSKKTMLRVSNAPGTVDNGYRGEVGVLVTNTLDRRVFLEPVIFSIEGEDIAHTVDTNMYTRCWHSPGSYLIRKGERFAQIAFSEVIRPLELVVGKVDDTDRGSGGFGSTGV